MSSATENGSVNTCYNRKKSGWFLAPTFEDWFQSQFLPAVKNEDSPLILIRDNLSCLISVQIVQAITI